MTAEVSRSDATGILRSRLQHDRNASDCGQCEAGDVADGCSSASVDCGTVSGDDADNVCSDGMHRVQDLGPSSDFRSCHSDKNMSLWTFLYIELTRGYWLEHDQARFAERRKRVYLFLTIPWELEKFIVYGFLQCVDGFLFIFTFLPLRFVKAFLKFAVRGCFSSCWKTAGEVLDPAEKCDLLKGVILIVCCLMMNWVDVSMMYHVIRGQTVIKLYIFFNMLDVADKLCSSFGQDILDSLFWTATEPRGRRREHLGLVIHVVMAIIYVFFHSGLVLLQANTLNVAFNSHNKALLTIMMSNNFVELKGSVFKKFEKNNLFQMSCSDVRERFHLMFLLTIVVIRNLTEFSWNLDHFWVLVPDIVLVMLAELLVDWVKHAFITKFNELQPEAFCDHLDTVSRRMGFIPLPLAVLLVRVVTQSVKVRSLVDVLIILLFYFCLLSSKVLNSIILLGKAHQYILDNRQAAAAAARARDQTVVEPKVVSKDDLDLLSSPKTSLTGLQSPDSPAIRRTQSLGEFSKDELLVATIETPPSYEGSLDDLSAGIIRQPSFGSNALLSNSTVSLVSVQLNSTFVEDKMAATAALTAPIIASPNGSFLDGSVIDVNVRKRQKSECSSGVEETEPPLSEVNRYTMCSNRII